MQTLRLRSLTEIVVSELEMLAAKRERYVFGQVGIGTPPLTT